MELERAIQPDSRGRPIVEGGRRDGTAVLMAIIYKEGETSHLFHSPDQIISSQ